MADAERAYRTAIELDPDAADPHLHLGHALKLQGHLDEAVKAYRHALTLDPAPQGASSELLTLGWTRDFFHQLGESQGPKIMTRAMDKTMDGPTQEEVDSIVWFHPFTFPNGVKTKGIKGGGGPEYCEAAVRLEAQAAFKYPVRGKTVLDVGAWNGYFSVEAFQQGARRVMALDKPNWENDYFRGLQGFELVRRYLSPNIEAVSRDVMDLRFDPVGKFDCVLFMGVLYHLKHPLYVLETLFDLTLEHLVVETHVDLVDYDRPAMAFYPGAEVGNDPTNWWGPNVQCVVDMLKTVGFSRVEHEFHPVTNTRAFFYAFK